LTVLFFWGILYMF